MNSNNTHEDLIKEIEKTLDQLILNAERLSECSSHLLFSEEVLMLKRAQDALLAHLMQTLSLLHSYDTVLFRKKMALLESLSEQLVAKVYALWTGKKAKLSKISNRSLEADAMRHNHLL